MISNILFRTAICLHISVYMCAWECAVCMFLVGVWTWSYELTTNIIPHWYHLISLGIVSNWIWSLLLWLGYHVNEVQDTVVGFTEVYHCFQVWTCVADILPSGTFPQQAYTLQNNLLCIVHSKNPWKVLIIDEIELISSTNSIASFKATWTNYLQVVKMETIHKLNNMISCLLYLNW